MMDCKPRADNCLFRDEVGDLLDWIGHLTIPHVKRHAILTYFQAVQRETYDIEFVSTK